MIVESYLQYRCRTICFVGLSNRATNNEAGLDKHVVRFYAGSDDCQRVCTHTVLNLLPSYS